MRSSAETSLQLHAGPMQRSHSHQQLSIRRKIWGTNTMTESEKETPLTYDSVSESYVIKLLPSPDPFMGLSPS
jgi:hypothetical protein